MEHFQQIAWGIPNEVKEIKNRDRNSDKVFWDCENKLVLNSNVVYAKSSGKRNVLFLSTKQPILGTTKEDVWSKPVTYKLYDFNNGGTDIVDQRMNFYSSKAKPCWWTISVFTYILDTCGINASSLITLKIVQNGDRKSFKIEFLVKF